MQNLSVHAVAHMTVVKTHAQFLERTHTLHHLGFVSD